MYRVCAVLEKRHLTTTLFMRVPSAFCVITTEPLYLRPPIVKYKSEAEGFIRFTTQVRIISELDSETSIFISSTLGFTVMMSTWEKNNWKKYVTCLLYPNDTVILKSGNSHYNLYTNERTLVYENSKLKHDLPLSWCSL